MSSGYVSIPGFGSGQVQAPVVSVFDLPANGNNIGDVRLVLDTYLNYFWNGSAWELVPPSGGTNDSVGPLGQPIPGSATLMGASDPTNDLAPLNLDADGNLKVAADAMPLPPGAATSALQVDGNASLAAIDSKLTAPLSVAGPLTDSELRAAPVPVSASALPLPSGAATAANQVTEIASLSSIDSKLTSPLSVTGPLTDTQLRASPVAVSAAALPLPAGAATEATLSTLNGKVPSGLTVTSTRLAVDGSGVTQPVSASSLPLPTGASTSALQTTGNTSLASIDSKLTSPLTVTGPLTDAQLRASAVPVSLGSSPLPAGAATAANQATEIASLSSIDSKLTSPLTVTGPLTDTQLRASPVPISGTVTANAGSGTFAISAAALPLPSGAATEATLGNVLTTSAFQARVNTLGQKTMANSTPVTIASDQTAIPASQSGTWDINNVSGTVSLPTGAATAALQTQPGVDIGDVTVNNGIGASAVNIQDGGNSITVDGPLTDTQLRATPVPVSGTVAATQSGTWTVQPGNTANTTAWKVDGSAVTQPVSGTVTANAGTNLNTSLLALESGGNLATIKTNSDNLALAQASTTSGQKGNLVLGAVTTAAPSYTTAQSNPLSLTTAGALRTDASATTQPVSGTVTAAQATAANLNAQVQGPAASGASKSGNPVQTGYVFNTTPPTVTNGQVVEAQATARGASLAHPSFMPTTGTFTANRQTITVSDAPYSTHYVAVTGTWVGTISPQWSADGVNWTNSNIYDNAGSLFTGITTNNTWISTAPMAYFRLTTTAWTSGTATISITSTQNVDTVYIRQRALYGLTVMQRPSIPTGNATYSASALAFTAANSATDIFTLTGSGTKTIYITKVTVSATQATAAVRDVVFLKRSTANSGGTASTLTAVPYDSAFSAATATARSYTVNPTTGNLVGNIGCYKLSIPTTTAVDLPQLNVVFGQDGPQPVVLRGTSEVFAVNLNGVTSGTNLFSITIEWMEA
jgi:hypothetical protein